MKFLKLSFLIGIGFLLGLLFGYLIFNNKQNEPLKLTEKIFKSPSKKTDEKTKNDKEVKKTNKNNNQNSKTELTTVKNEAENIENFDSLHIDESIELDESDSMFFANADTTHLNKKKEEIQDDNLFEEPTNKINIQKEELLFSIELFVIVLDTVTTKPQLKDTLVEKVADVKPKPENLKYKVEFWDSPINFSGYKMANNRLVLFGLEYFESQTKLFSYKQKTYLKNLNDYYLLEISYDYKPYKKVKDTDLINRFDRRLR